MVAPHNMRERFTDLIHREVQHIQAGRPSGIKAKMNQLQDARMIRELCPRKGQKRCAAQEMFIEPIAKQSKNNAKV